MKKSRKQKLRQRFDRKEGARQRKYAIVDRLLKLLDIEDPLAPDLAILREEFAKRVRPSVDVVVSDKSKGDMIVEMVRRQIETIVEKPIRFTLGDRTVSLALADYYRGYFAIMDLMEKLYNYLESSKITRPSASVPGFRAAWARVQHFDAHDLNESLLHVLRPVNRVVDSHLKYGEQIVWYRMEQNPKYSDRAAVRIVVGRRPQTPHYLPFGGQRRKCYPFEMLDPQTGVCRPTWKPAELGLGSSDKALPIYISGHAIARLYERIPLAPCFGIQDRILRDALFAPRAHPSSREGEFLVEAGDPDQKFGYFVVAVLPDYVFVKTFLFLTMQGTPEARLLRIKAGLSRNDIMAFKLDHLFTLAYSDIGQDADLRALLAECGCDHLLRLFRPDTAVSWLETYRDPLRRAAGLSLLGRAAQDAGGTPAGMVSADSMAAYAERCLRASQGWTT
jgi:hypothetical protein